MKTLCRVSVLNTLLVTGLLGFCLVGGGAEVTIRADKTEAFLSLLKGGQPILQYRHDAQPDKPYLKELFTPGNVQVLRDAPADHIHHHGIMFAVAVDDLTFWAEGAGEGHQRPRSLGEVTVRSAEGLTRAFFTQELDWVKPGVAEPLLTESRTIEAYAGEGVAATLLSWRSRLRPGPGRQAVKLGGSHYYGLGMRFLQSMDGVGRFVYASGKPGEIVRGEERLTRSKWCAYVCPDPRRPVTVALFDHPSNPRHPATIFTMPVAFAYLSGTLNLWKEPMTLSQGEKLELCYGIAVWDGEVAAEEVERVYQKWLGLAGG